MVHRQHNRTEAETLHTGHSRPATKEELVRFFDHFEEALVDSGFLRHPDKRPASSATCATSFSAPPQTEQELRTLHGVVTSFMAGSRNAGDPAVDAP